MQRIGFTLHRPRPRAAAVDLIAPDASKKGAAGSPQSCRNTHPDATVTVEQERLTEGLAAVAAKNVDKSGKIQMISKDETKEILGRSPDHADARGD